VQVTQSAIVLLKRIAIVLLKTRSMASLPVAAATVFRCEDCWQLWNDHPAWHCLL